MISFRAFMPPQQRYRTYIGPPWLLPLSLMVQPFRDACAWLWNSALERAKAYRYLLSSKLRLMTKGAAHSTHGIQQS